MQSARIFISYRRDDTSGHAGRLFDRLVDHCGRDQVFRDIDDIRAGQDFEKVLLEQVGSCDVLLVVIGQRWLSATDQDGQWRLANVRDYVRLEITTALTRNIRVIPVLVQDARLPQARDLPAALGGLARRHAVEIRDTHFDQDVTILAQLLTPRWHHRLLRHLHRPAAYAAAAVLLVTALTAWLYPSLMLTPQRARLQLGQLGIEFSSQAFTKAAARGDAHTVELFLRAGINPDRITRIDGADCDSLSAVEVPAIECATRMGQRGMVLRLMEAGADPSAAVSVALEKDDAELVNLLLAAISDPADLSDLLQVAVQHGDFRIFQQLIERGADVNHVSDTGWTALHQAAYSTRSDFVEQLIKLGAKSNAVDGRKVAPLHAALFNCSASQEESIAEVTELLLDAGANANAVTATGDTALLSATKCQAATVASGLLEHGADVKYANRDDRTALHEASSRGMVTLIKTLLERGAPIDAVDEQGKTPLYDASINENRLEAAQALLLAGANVNIASKSGQTPLHNAVDFRNQTLSRALLERGADPNAKSHNNKTPLMEAVHRGASLSLIEALLAKHADINAADSDGETALDMAYSSKRPDVARRLRARGARSGHTRVAADD